MKTISVINEKGGVCKTTTAINIGELLGRKGYSVLFVDTDPQGNMTRALKEGGDTASLSTVLKQPETAEAAIKRGVRYKCALLPSSRELSMVDREIPPEGREYRLKQSLASLAGQFDYCIIDTPPALGTLTINALTASESVIIPTSADIFALEGIGQLSSTIETIRQLTNPSLYIRGILLTRYNKRSVFRSSIAELLEQQAEALNTRVYKTYIREGVAIPEAHALRKSLFDYAPRSNAAQDYKHLIEEILTYEQERHI